MSAKKGELHHNWKGDKVKMPALHEWIAKRKPRVKECERCHQRKKLELSNNSGEYKRDIKDFEWLCRSCHGLKDKNAAKLTKNNVRKIRELYRFNPIPRNKHHLAKMFNTTYMNIHYIVTEKTWQNI